MDAASEITATERVPFMKWLRSITAVQHACVNKCVCVGMCMFINVQVHVSVSVCGIECVCVCLCLCLLKGRTIARFSREYRLVPACQRSRLLICTLARHIMHTFPITRS